jgi:two-component system, NarL family, invasion response regulator UvrY
MLEKATTPGPRAGDPAVPQPIQVMIIDNHPTLRLGVRSALADASDIEIIAEWDGGEGVLDKVAAVRPHVIVLDISMPGIHGIEVLRQLRANACGIPTLIYTRFPEEQYAIRTLRAGAAGYLSKTAHPSELARAVRTVARGDVYTSPRVAALLRDELTQTGERQPHSDLSDREFEVLRMILAGKSITRIAADMGLSVKTVSTHRARVLQKLGLTSTAQLVRYAIEHGLDDSLN